ncbi:hypothetical protein [Paenibacillus glucanolyticus]|uniref:hypothetical protein n=1 Tax=Paenibacillus glucanolyticus TaxID=59843 RepID=UPI001E3515B9|nr:hypothetical protein [Paenibacillus glucanolyticus]
MVDKEKCSDVTLRDLHLEEKPFITFRIGIKPDAKHQGGSICSEKDWRLRAGHCDEAAV